MHRQRRAQTLLVLLLLVHCSGLAPSTPAGFAPAIRCVLWRCARAWCPLAPAHLKVQGETVGNILPWNGRLDRHRSAICARGAWDGPAAEERDGKAPGSLCGRNAIPRPRGASGPEMGWGSRFSGPSQTAGALRAQRGAREGNKIVEFDKNILTYKGYRWPRDMFQFIVEEIGVPRHQISHVAEASQVMYLNVSNLQPKFDYFTHGLKIPRKSLGRIVGSFPQLLTLDLENNLKPKLRYLETDFGIPEDQLGKVVMRHPQLLGLSLAQNIKPTVDFLADDALVPRDRLATLVRRYPTILSQSIEGNLRPTVVFLREQLGVEPGELGKAIGSNPMLLSVSLERSLKVTVQFYLTELRVPRPKLARMLVRFPGLLTLNIDHNVKPKIELFVNGIGFSLRQASDFIAEHPQVLRRSRYSLWSTHNGLISAGFPPKAVRKMLAEHPRLLVYGGRDTAEHLIAALQAPPLSFSAARARKLAARFPSLLAVRSAADRVRALTSFLIESGVREQALPRIVDKFPLLLALSTETRLKPTLGFLVDQLQLTPEETGLLVERAPALLGHHPIRSLQPKIDLMIDRVGLEPAVLRSVVLRAPATLYVSPRKLTKNLAFLLDVARIPPTRLPRMVEKAPSVLCLSADSNMRPILDLMTAPHGLGIAPGRAGLMLARQPQILMSSLDDKLLPCIDFLCGQLQLTRAEAAKVVQGNPSILGFSVPLNLQLKVDFYCSELCISPAQVGKMVWSFPPLLSLSIESNIKLKLRYLFRYMQVDKQTIISSPQLLAYSLRGRIYPRHLHINAIGAQGQVSLSSLLGMPDAAFYERFPSTYKKPRAFNVSLADLAVVSQHLRHTRRSQASSNTSLAQAHSDANI